MTRQRTSSLFATSSHSHSVPWLTRYSKPRKSPAFATPSTIDAGRRRRASTAATLQVRGVGLPPPRVGSPPGRRPDCSMDGAAADPDHRRMTSNLSRRRIPAVLITALTASLAVTSLASAQPTAFVTQTEDGNGPPNNRISVVDAATGAEVGGVTVGHDPGGVVLSPDGTRAYTA